MVIKVAVQQRQRLFREGLDQLIGAEDDMEVVGTAASSEELRSVCAEHRPDAALIEVDVRDWDAGQLTTTLRRTMPKLRVIGLSAGDVSTADVNRARFGGIKQILPRSAGIGQILLALRVKSSLNRLSPFCTAVPVGATTDPGAAGSGLTARELTVLNLVGAGLTSRQISSELAISHKTVENHKQRIFGKLGVQNQAHAVSVAMRRGLMRPERVIGLSLAD